MYSLVVIINKYINYFDQFKYHKICDTMKECESVLVDFISGHVKDLNIDFPLDLEDFNTIWFDNNRVEADSFTYLIIPLNKSSITYNWNEPWNLNDVYDLLLDNIHKIELENQIHTSNQNSNSDDEDN